MNLETLTSSELVAKYNDLALKVGGTTVKKFSDKKTAIRRTAALLKSLSEHQPLVTDDPEAVAVTPEPEPAPKQSKKMWSNFLGMRQDIKAQDVQVPLKREGSIRAAALVVLRRGATLGQLSAIFIEHDRRRNVAPKDALRRSYEMVRIFCHYHGYGTESSGDGTVIKLVTE